MNDTVPSSTEIREWLEADALGGFASGTSTGHSHISEIADADPPHTPRGCPWQAWSVGEVLRLDHLILAERTDGARISACFQSGARQGSQARKLVLATKTHAASRLRSVKTRESRGSISPSVAMA